jgi:hypothetical protein
MSLKLRVLQRAACVMAVYRSTGLLLLFEVLRRAKFNRSAKCVSVANAACRYTDIFNGVPFFK